MWDFVIAAGVMYPASFTQTASVHIRVPGSIQAEFVSWLHFHTTYISENTKEKSSCSHS